MDFSGSVRWAGWPALTDCISQLFPAVTTASACKTARRVLRYAAGDLLADLDGGVWVVTHDGLFHVDGHGSGGVQSAEAGVGGTSLATPIFSAIWAIASQYNGKPLGFAAPVVARLKKGEITDVIDTSDLSTDSLSGTIVDQNGSTFFSTNALFAGQTPR